MAERHGPPAMLNKQFMDMTTFHVWAGKPGDVCAGNLIWFSNLPQKTEDSAGGKLGLPGC